jgi:drug/metabolite transporter (DMT)-like permease
MTSPFPLIVLAVAPLVTALLARALLQTPIPPRTWIAIFVAMAGIGWMFAGSLRIESPASVLGMLVAFGAPIASAINFVILKKRGQAVDLIPAVFLGGVISAALMLPLAWPFIARPTDIGLLAVLGFFQLGLPCTLLVIAARHCLRPGFPASALEVVLPSLWAGWARGEAPGANTLAGGAFVIAALLSGQNSGRVPMRDGRLVGVVDYLTGSRCNETLAVAFAPGSCCPARCVRTTVRTATVTGLKSPMSASHPLHVPCLSRPG